MEVQDAQDVQDVPDAGDAQVGAKLLGVVMGQITGIDPYDKVMSALNGSQSTDFSTYFADITARLSQIESELDDVADAVQEVSTKQTQIQISLTDAKLQTVLGQYEADVSVINQGYATLNSALGALQSKDSKTKQAGAQLLVEITAPTQISTVETAMLNLGTALLGDGIFKGVLGYMPDLLDAAVRGLGPNNPSSLTATVCGRPCYDSFWLLTQFYPQYTSTITNAITPLFSSVLAVLQKGITQLEMAYIGTIQEHQLTAHYANVVSICTYINGFWGAVTDPTTLGAAMMSAFNTVSKTTIDTRLKQMCWAHWNAITPDPNDDGGVANYPFPGNYGGWATVASKASSRPPGWSSRTPIVASIAPNFTFGASVYQFMFSDAGDYVQFGMAFGIGRGTLVLYPIPTVAEFFGTGGPPQGLADTASLLADANLLTAQTLPSLA